jgi:hypothetical protein
MSARVRFVGLARRAAAGAASVAAQPATRGSSDQDRVLALIGAQLARDVRRDPSDNPADDEFHVFSQFGEDGILQNLLARVAIEDETFVEFGVADYAESNTRFLLVNDNWRGLIIDGGDAHIEFLAGASLDWRHDIQALKAFVTRDNIDGLIASAGIGGDIGLLSIDVDGNDLWVLERIEAVSARILVVEYNATFGPDAAVTVPYDPDFQRTEKHWSNLYWGASLAALERAARARGYSLVAANRAGNNAFFVRDDVLGDIPVRAAADVYRPSRFRESRGPDGALTFIGPIEDRLRVIRDLPLWDLETQTTVTVGERFGLDGRK